MRAMVVREFGGLDALNLEDIASPALGTGQVRVRVHACGVNFADTLIIKGEYQVKPEFPFAPGLECAGEIIEVGDGVTGFALGQRVLAMTGYGGFSEEAVVAETACVPLPDEMSDVDAAAFPVAYGTSHVGLTYKAGLKANEVLLVHGASGGVGLTAVEIGKHLGATVIATASSAEKLEVARSKGADHLIDYSTEETRERVKELTGGKGADVIYDPVGGKAFEASLRCINFEGRIVVIGFASGTIPQIPANIILIKNLDVLGLYWGSYMAKKPQVIVDSFTELMGWYVEGAIRPHVSAIYPLADAKQALTDMLTRKSTGKIVIEI